MATSRRRAPGTTAAASPSSAGHRFLSNESSENADRIKDLVRQVQSQITRVASDIELAGKTAADETEKAKTTTTNLERVAIDVERAGRAIQEVAVGAQEAGKALEQAGKATEQIAAAAVQMTNSTAEAAGAGEEASKAADEIAQAVEEIASQADEVQYGDGLSVKSRRRVEPEESIMAQAEAGLQAARHEQENQLVTFCLGNEEFGFDIMSVQEIIRQPVLSRVPMAPDYVEGSRTSAGRSSRSSTRAPGSA